jgi:hypothetical protein
MEKIIKLSDMIKMVEYRLKYLKRKKKSIIKCLNWWTVSEFEGKIDECAKLLTKLKAMDGE